MADISKITLPSGTTYNIKDETARNAIAELENFTDFLGVTTTALTDGATTNPVTINGASVTAKKGNIVTYQSKEFIFNGTAWQEFGDLSGLGALAYKNSASGSVTAAGSVSQPTFTGSEMTSTGSFTPSGNVTITKGTGTANYTPEGTNSAPAFTGTAGSVSVSGTPKGSVSISTGTGTANYTPAGSVSAPTITVTPNTGTVNSITAVGTLPAWSGTVADETLTIAWNAGTLPTKGSNQTVVTGIKSATASEPSFTGTGAQLEATFSGQATTSTGTFTPEGSVAAPVFTGTGVKLNGAFTGTAGSVSVSGTPGGTVSKPTFTGSAVTVSVS